MSTYTTDYDRLVIDDLLPRLMVAGEVYSTAQDAEEEALAGALLHSLLAEIEQLLPFCSPETIYACAQRHIVYHGSQMAVHDDMVKRLAAELDIMHDMTQCGDEPAAHHAHQRIDFLRREIVRQLPSCSPTVQQALAKLGLQESAP